jgi:hypothetical protein
VCPTTFPFTPLLQKLAIEGRQWAVAEIEKEKKRKEKKRMGS